ncbi:MAG TPA: LapA family protein [Caldithrix sp.]|nr:LapA family protein [Caldithrix sp.]
MRPKQIAILVIVVFMLIILFQNLASVPLHLLLWQPNISLALILLVPFILGVVVGWLLKMSLAKKKMAQPTE